MLVLTASGVGHAVVSSVESGMDRVDPFHGLDDRPAAGRGLNVLLIGSDSRKGVTEEERQEYHLGGDACDCADTMMLIHLSEDGKRASVVGLPRDSYVELPSGPGKMNAALAQGGPSLVVSTVEELTGVRVDHYLEVNFVSFMRSVDELGGVEVCTSRRLQDSGSGLDLPVGTSTLDGGQALQYVRARDVDGAADFGRMHRQQRFLAAYLDQAVSAEVLLNPAKLGRVSSALLGSVRVDPGLGADEIRNLAGALGDFRTSGAEFTSVPVDDVSHSLPAGGGTAVTWDEEAAQRLFEALRADQPLSQEGDGAADAEPVPVEIPPAGVQVQVENASGRQGLGAETDKSLRDAGFSTTGSPRNGEGQADGQTTITHDPAHRDEALSLRQAAPGAHLREEDGHGRVLVLSVAEEFQGVRSVRDAASPMRAEEWGNGGYGAATADQITCD